MQTANADFLNSSWLIKMLEKSSQKPHARLLNVFDILDDWLDSPNIATNVELNVALNIAPSYAEPLDAGLLTKQNSQHKPLQDFLTLEATKAGAILPEALASQLYYMALAAMQEKQQSNNPKSLQHAKNAAKALLGAQTTQNFYFKNILIAKPTSYAKAAIFAAACVVAGGFIMLNGEHTNQNIAAKQVPIQTVIPQMVAAEAMADPQQTIALMAQIEQMRHGNCQLIEAIQLPDSQKGIYINMVVNGQVSTNAKEQAIAFDLLRRTRCNYTPMLMANSK